MIEIVSPENAEKKTESQKGLQMGSEPTTLPDLAGGSNR